MPLSDLEMMFKFEARKKGETLARNGKVSNPQASDTQIQLFVRESSGSKVTLKTDSVEDPSLLGECGCTQARKGQLCRHIWAALVTINEKVPDFLEFKTNVSLSPNFKDTSASFTKRELTEKQIETQAAYKQKQSEYRKEQYQKQKQILKEKKKSKLNQPPTSIYPENVNLALSYFSENGFDLSESINKESISSAKKQLARVFHPDKGGSPAEILELNRFAEILEKYVSS
jgi:hypothetical protein